MIVMEKAHFSTTEDKVYVNIPFSKANVDQEKRIVSGFGTIDNPDQTDDVITKEASIEAWKAWRGNVREQHSDLAAGKVLNWRPESYMADDGQVYNGLYVDVYVSKGAPATWEKVLDGTLSGFSVGGNILECHTEYLADDDRTVRYITKYKMVELSLVDSPGNELCNVLTVQKSADGSDKIEGLLAETKTNNVFWCPTDRIAVAAHEEVRKCSACSTEMENIGWYEIETGVPEGESVKKVLQASKKLEKVDAVKGGSEMSDEKQEEVKPVVETTEVEAAEKQEAAPEVSETVSEVAEPDLATITKALDEIKETLGTTTQQNREETVAEIQKAVASVKEDVDAKLADLLTKHTSLEEEVKGFKENLGTVEKSLKSVLGAVEKSTAVKKSADIEEEEEIKKAAKSESLWSNRFLPPTYDRN